MGIFYIPIGIFRFTLAFEGCLGTHLLRSLQDTTSTLYSQLTPQIHNFTDSKNFKIFPTNFRQLHTCDLPLQPFVFLHLSNTSHHQLHNILTPFKPHVDQLSRSIVWKLRTRTLIYEYTHYTPSTNNIISTHLAHASKKTSSYASEERKQKKLPPLTPRSDLFYSRREFSVYSQDQSILSPIRWCSFRRFKVHSTPLGRFGEGTIINGKGFDGMKLSLAQIVGAIPA